jgi:beta-glucosidase
VSRASACVVRRASACAVRRASACLALATILALRSAGAQLPYRDARLPVAERVRDLVGRMTLEEKFWQLYMIPGNLDDTTHDYSHGVFGLQTRSARNARADAALHNAMQRFFVERTRLGIPMLPFEEGVHGVMRNGATVFPQAIGLAATWDSALVGRVSEAIARETRSRGVRQVLSPVVNIATDVRWGRVEETYGEDPYLSSVMGRAFVRAFEGAGIVATPKHFVANVGDGGRDSYPIDVSARLLEETHFPPFRSAILDAGARSIMTSYNSVDGLPATQNRALLTDKLRRDWGFTGFVISDQSATGGATVLHHTEANTATATKRALEAGLDVIFQSSWPQHRPYLAALRGGTIATAVIDSAVARVLRAKFELGLFESPFVSEDSAAHWNRHATHRALAREAARASIVLLRNDRAVLPLGPNVRTVAVIGAAAAEPRLGGYTIDSAPAVSILTALRARLGPAAVRYVPGVAAVPAQELRVVSPESFAGLRGEYWDNNRLEGAPRVTRDDPNIDFRWTLNSPARGIPFDWYSVRWTGRLRTPPSGVTRIGVEGNDGYRLYLDGRLLIDNWRKQSHRTTSARVALPAGSMHDIRLEYFESTGNARVKLVWDAGVTDNSSSRIATAVTAARQSDVAIVVVSVEEGEFRDRALLSLPGRQEELIERVAGSGKPVVVVLVGGSAITMSRWLDRVDAVIDAWYPGEEGGHAVTDVLFGAYNPAGRLPITFPVSEGQLPLYYNHKPTGRGDDYVDLTGQPLFPFGFGLSYTTFEYSALSVEPTAIASGGRARISFRVRNTGTRAGDEVVQLYVRDVLASVARPVMELKGFTRVPLQPGEEREIAFQLGTDDLRMLDEQMRWVTEPGAFRVMIGSSSKDIRLRGELTVQP